MKQQTGWAKCPMCEGSGEVVPNVNEIEEAARSNRELYASHANSGSYLNTALVREVPPKIMEPCQTCKDQEFKGCLPVYGEVEDDAQ